MNDWRFPTQLLCLSPLWRRLFLIVHFQFVRNTEGGEDLFFISVLLLLLRLSYGATVNCVQLFFVVVATLLNFK